MTTKPHRKQKELLISLLGIAPVILLTLAFKAYPLGSVIYKSMTNWDGLFRQDFIGLKNYLRLFRSEYFWKTLVNCFIILINVPIQIFVGLIVSMLLYEKTPGWRFFRSLYYLPQIVSSVIVGYLFAIFFSYSGPVNQILKSIGLERFAIEWLGSRTTAFGVVILALVWINIGWQGVLILGGLSSIDPSVFDAAKIDGTNFFQRTFYVMLPMIGRVIEYSFVYSVAWTFTGVFPFIYSITNGGPGYDTTTLDFLVYQKAFREDSALGEACALAVLLLIIVSLLTLIQRKISSRVNEWSD
ncbi:MAG TPA: sugar ABC transporter permease [Sphaerochaeta sp.]|jgi:multiple sugar transport system permease protein|nr:sugar ABC transporter permease [Sphaerochaeta sp.]HQB89691.1 sugar ABC transporter permease [Sphaerochaeta sp.]